MPSPMGISGEISPLYDGWPAFQLMRFEGLISIRQATIVPSNGLENATRAYAHIIDESTELILKIAAVTPVPAGPGAAS